MRIKWFSLVRITGLLLVLLYHYFQGVFPGGFIGVDIFFTFSGFLITSLLIDEFAKKKEIDIQGFFKRRFYRIVPPLVFMILVVMPFTLLIRKDFVAGIGTQIAAALGFVTNFYEMLSGGSYESQFVPHILIHTWSLALEVHYYVLWGLAAWGLGKVAKSTARYRGMIALVSAGLFLLSFVSMFAGALTTKNFSDIYFSSLTHVFPFFAGSILATLSGVGHVSSRFKMLEEKLTLKQVLGIMGGSAAVLLLLSFLLKFDNLWTYLVGFLISTILASLMILAARMLHDKLPDVKEPSIINFIADTSYGVYLFHWPFYIIFTQLMSNILAVLLTTLLSFIFAALSFYILEPTLAGRQPVIMGTKMDLSSLTRPVFYSMIPLALIMFFISVTAPKVGAFEESLIVNALNQADTKMQTTRSQVDQSKATEYNVADGITMIGDSVALRSSEQLQQILPGIELDTVVSRSLSTGLEVYKTDIANRVLKKQVVLALGTNSSGYSNELLDEYVSSLPKGHQLILVTPYDGRSEGGVLAQQREYELELAKKYDYVFVADWHQTAIENPQIWEGTDYVHFGSNSESIIEGGTLYANTIKQAIDEANSGNVKP
ncbi:acyltransferase family protein [Streptococcus sanguinis]|uniref:acyltransferase family protein n=1 Tax=Streptococcus sanguinis TaxID=1305 RepID=UPI002954C8DB|nr:acyltransferase family protein [Streptococcus sanguinis]MCC3166093.1 acyltransferase family protein [Streptococcus sanguinis]